MNEYQRIWIDGEEVYGSMRTRIVSGMKMP